MFSGKTEELIRRAVRDILSKKNVKIFKPEVDQRYSATDVVSHNSTSVPAIVVKNAKDILLHIDAAEVVAIDEAQFFDVQLVDVCHELAAKNIRVIVAGLDMDYAGKPFGPMPQMLAIADEITKLHAICVQCGNLANFTHRINTEEELIVLGEKDKYTALCRACYNNKKQ